MNNLQVKVWPEPNQIITWLILNKGTGAASTNTNGHCKMDEENQIINHAYSHKAI